MDDRPAHRPGPPRLLERDGELDRIDAALADAAAGAGSLLLIEGPAGIGKTELLTAAVRQARDAGMAVAHARGSELERELAFGVVRRLLEPIVARSDAAVRVELSSGAPALAQPLFAHDPAGSGPVDAQPFTVLHGLYWTCVSLVQAAPLLVAVDDAHWADLASLRFLVYLAARLEGLPLALMVATRPAEHPAEEDLLAHLAADPRAVTIAPVPLTPGAIAALLSAEFGCEPDPSFVTACSGATGGTPYLVRELFRELRTLEVEPVATEAARIADLGPRTIGRAVLARVRRLGPDAPAVTRAAAVLDADAHLHRVAGLAGVRPDAAAGALDALCDAGVISPGRPVAFVHPIVRHAVHAEIPTGERSLLHTRAAALLAREGVAEERIAGHLLASHPAGDPRTVELLTRTARAAAPRAPPPRTSNVLWPNRPRWTCAPACCTGSAPQSSTAGDSRRR